MVWFKDALIPILVSDHILHLNTHTRTCTQKHVPIQ